MARIRRIPVLAVASALLLTACAAPPRTAQQDAAVRSVAIVSQLDEAAPVLRLGITIFGNEKKILDQGGKLNEMAVETVKQHLGNSRPNWNVKVATPKMAMTADGKPAERMTAAELAALAQSLGVDQLFVLNGASYDNSPGRGTGVVTRPLGFGLLSVSVHSFITLTVMDRNGVTLLDRGVGSDGVKNAKADELGLTSDLKSLDAPAVSANVSAALQKRTREVVDVLMTSANY